MSVADHVLALLTGDIVPPELQVHRGATEVVLGGLPIQRPWEDKESWLLVTRNAPALAIVATLDLVKVKSPLAVALVSALWDHTEELPSLDVASVIARHLDSPQGLARSRTLRDRAISYSCRAWLIDGSEESYRRAVRSLSQWSTTDSNIVSDELTNFGSNNKFWEIAAEEDNGFPALQRIAKAVLELSDDGTCRSCKELLPHELRYVQGLGELLPQIAEAVSLTSNPDEASRERFLSQLAPQMRPSDFDTLEALRALVTYIPRKGSTLASTDLADPVVLAYTSQAHAPRDFEDAQAELRTPVSVPPLLKPPLSIGLANLEWLAARDFHRSMGLIVSRRDLENNQQLLSATRRAYLRSAYYAIGGRHQPTRYSDNAHLETAVSRSLAGLTLLDEGMDVWGSRTGSGRVRASGEQLLIALSNLRVATQLKEKADLARALLERQLDADTYRLEAADHRVTARLREATAATLQAKAAATRRSALEIELQIAGLEVGRTGLLSEAATEDLKKKQAEVGTALLEQGQHAYHKELVEYQIEASRHVLPLHYVFLREALARCRLLDAALADSPDSPVGQYIQIKRDEYLATKEKDILGPLVTIGRVVADVVSVCFGLPSLGTLAYVTIDGIVNTAQGGWQQGLSQLASATSALGISVGDVTRQIGIQVPQKIKDSWNNARGELERLKGAYGDALQYCRKISYAGLKIPDDLSNVLVLSQQQLEGSILNSLAADLGSEVRTAQEIVRQTKSRYLHEEKQLQAKLQRAEGAAKQLLSERLSSLEESLNSELSTIRAQVQSRLNDHAERIASEYSYLQTQVARAEDDVEAQARAVSSALLNELESSGALDILDVVRNEKRLRGLFSKLGATLPANVPDANLAQIARLTREIAELHLGKQLVERIAREAIRNNSPIRFLETQNDPAVDVGVYREDLQRFIRGYATQLSKQALGQLNGVPPTGAARKAINDTAVFISSDAETEQFLSELELRLGMLPRAQHMSPARGVKGFIADLRTNLAGASCDTLVDRLTGSAKADLLVAILEEAASDANARRVKSSFGKWRQHQTNASDILQQVADDAQSLDHELRPRVESILRNAPPPSLDPDLIGRLQEFDKALGALRQLQDFVATSPQIKEAIDRLAKQDDQFEKHRARFLEELRTPVNDIRGRLENNIRSLGYFPEDLLREGGLLSDTLERQIEEVARKHWKVIEQTSLWGGQTELGIEEREQATSKARSDMMAELNPVAGSLTKLLPSAEGSDDVNQRVTALTNKPGLLGELFAAYQENWVAALELEKARQKLLGTGFDRNARQYDAAAARLYREQASLNVARKEILIRAADLEIRAYEEQVKVAEAGVDEARAEFRATQAVLNSTRWQKARAEAIADGLVLAGDEEVASLLQSTIISLAFREIVYDTGIAPQCRRLVGLVGRDWTADAITMSESKVSALRELRRQPRGAASALYVIPRSDWERGVPVQLGGERYFCLPLVNLPPKPALREDMEHRMFGALDMGPFYKLRGEPPTSLDWRKMSRSYDATWDNGSRWIEPAGNAKDEPGPAFVYEMLFVEGYLALPEANPNLRLRYAVLPGALGIVVAPPDAFFSVDTTDRHSIDEMRFAATVPEEVRWWTFEEFNKRRGLFDTPAGRSLEGTSTPYYGLFWLLVRCENFSDGRWQEYHGDAKLNLLTIGHVP